MIRKGGKKDLVSVTPSSLQDLKAYLEIRSERYKASHSDNKFDKNYKGMVEPLTNRAVENIVYKYTKAFDKRMSPHKLRHTYATNLSANRRRYIFNHESARTYTIRYCPSLHQYG